MNLLLICSDMVGARHLGCYGDPVQITPNIDQLAARGTRFEAAYCATTPCIPARVSLMSGQYAHTHGKLVHLKMPLEPRPTLLPEIFTKQGYQTGLVGKTHFWPSNDDLGFQEAHITIDNHLTPELGMDDAYMRFLHERGLFTFNAETWAEDRQQIHPDNLPDDALKVNWTGDTATDMLARFATDPQQRPFLLYCSFVEPHGPGSVKTALRESFAERDLRPLIPVGDNIPPTQRRAVEQWQQTSPADQHWYRAGVYASVHLMDANVGKLLAKLDELNLREDTLVIFFTDHGDLMYDHGCIEKNFLYEPAVNIPWIMAGPGIPIGETRSQFVSQVDLLPTVLDLCGIADLPPRVEGYSLRPVLDQSVSHWRESIFCECEQSVRLRELAKSSIAKMIRSGPWKYIYTLVNGELVEEELYNLEDDPDELHNRAGEASQQARVTQLRAEILNWLMRGEVNRLRPVPENHYPVPTVSEQVIF